MGPKTPDLSVLEVRGHYRFRALTGAGSMEANVADAELVAVHEPLYVFRTPKTEGEPKGVQICVPASRFLELERLSEKTKGAP